MTRTQKRALKAKRLQIKRLTKLEEQVRALQYNQRVLAQPRAKSYFKGEVNRWKG